MFVTELVLWNLLGEHNMQNGLCAIYAAHHIGVEIKTASEALNTFQGVKACSNSRFLITKVLGW
jgi:UDP-N-acetylmuramate-alanine ligase